MGSMTGYSHVAINADDYKSMKKQYENELREEAMAKIRESGSRYIDIRNQQEARKKKARLQAAAMEKK